MSAKNKTALITGAARRVGRAIALRLAKERFSIAVHYHRSKEEATALVEEIRRGGGTATSYRADLSDPMGAEKVADEVWAESGGVDLLVNNASVWVATPIDSLTPEEFDRQIAINLRSPFLLSVRIGRRMRERGSGQIVSILDWSIDRPYADHLAYGVAKAGLAAATRGLARALAPGVRVNAVAPGPVLLPDDLESKSADSIRRAVPLGRIGDPNDVAEAIVYLLGADYVTGAILTVDGGRSLR